ncbi:hypothetical protein HDE_03888 [Halotydeus destructor]|nr:hypothetical protein HDE_03888 [Halotydeus destructor]
MRLTTRSLASSTKAPTEGSSKDSKPKISKEKKPKAAEVVNQPAGNEYGAPEFYKYNVDTYAELFVEMDKYRLPQPSAKSSK